MSQPASHVSRNTWQETLRDRMRSLSRFGRTQYWVIKHASLWLLGFTVLYALGGVLLGWRAAYEVLVGLKPPADAAFPVFGYVLSLAGWLVVPAFVGATAGYLVTRKIEGRRTVTLEALLDQMRAQAGGPGSPPPIPAPPRAGNPGAPSRASGP
ncbi:DUF6313 family protein [Streptomyces sp. NPDC060235]|uniref:DUF6313 family protein n=1 Tax=Streptomyces sp. NPDC060235 TaxID=3347080 RepID=UPI003665F022